MYSIGKYVSRSRAICIRYTVNMFRNIWQYVFAIRRICIRNYLQRICIRYTVSMLCIFFTVSMYSLYGEYIFVVYCNYSLLFVSRDRLKINILKLCNLLQVVLKEATIIQSTYICNMFVLVVPRLLTFRA